MLLCRKGFPPVRRWLRLPIAASSRNAVVRLPMPAGIRGTASRAAPTLMPTGVRVAVDAAESLRATVSRKAASLPETSSVPHRRSAPRKVNGLLKASARHRQSLPRPARTDAAETAPRWLGSTRARAAAEA